jgi:hypothetical protein
LVAHHLSDSVALQHADAQCVTPTATPTQSPTLLLGWPDATTPAWPPHMVLAYTKRFIECEEACWLRCV